MEVVPRKRRPYSTLEKLEMKKTLVALAAFSAVSAFAQSTVTISGSINYGVQRSGATGVQTLGAVKGDRNNLSFDVSEDMGGGTSAIAKMQFRFLSQDGGTGYASTNAYEFSNSASLMEQTMVGLTSSSMGTVKFGRFTNDLGTHDFSVWEDAKFGTNASNAMYGRLSGSVQYTSPTVSGFKVGLINAKAANNCWGNPGGATGGGVITGINYCTYSSTGINNFGAAVITYANGPVLAQAATIGGLYGDKDTRLSLRYELSNGTKVYAGSYKQTGAVGLPIAAVASTYSTSPVAITTSMGLQAHTSTEFGVSVPVGAFTLRASYLMNNNDLAYVTGVATTDGTTKVNKASLGGEYSLSKRTMIMVQGGKVSNSTATLAASNALYTPGASYFVGMQHTF